MPYDGLLTTFQQNTGDFAQSKGPVDWAMITINRNRK